MFYRLKENPTHATHVRPVHSKALSKNEVMQEKEGTCKIWQSCAGAFHRFMIMRSKNFECKVDLSQDTEPKCLIFSR